MSVDGLDAILKRIQNIVTQIPSALGEALYEESELVMTESRGQIPVDTGAARSSAYVNQPQVFPDKATIELGYGGAATKINPKTKLPTTEYLIKIHEDMNVKHKVGNAKFLENPVKKWGKKLPSNLMRRIEGILRRNTIP